MQISKSTGSEIRLSKTMSKVTLHKIIVHEKINEHANFKYNTHILFCHYFGWLLPWLHLCVFYLIQWNLRRRIFFIRVARFSYFIANHFLLCPQWKYYHFKICFDVSRISTSYVCILKLITLCFCSISRLINVFLVTLDLSINNKRWLYGSSKWPIRCVYVGMCVREIVYESFWMFFLQHFRN